MAILPIPFGTSGWQETLNRFLSSVSKVNEAPLSPYRYGFVGDGVADDTAALQAALDALPAGGEMRLPHTGNAKITAPLVVAKPLTVQGMHRESQRVLAVGCDAFRVNAGVDGVRLRDLELAAGTRYTTTSHEFAGVVVEGSSADHPAEHLYENVFCDGFHSGWRTRYLWSSVFRNVRTAYCHRGIDAYGKSVNNFVTGGSRFSVGGADGSAGIRLIGRESYTDTTPVASEGWVINGILTTGAEVGIHLFGTNHVTVADCILDFNQVNGVKVEDNGTNFANNVSVHDTYIGMSGAASDAAISLGNTVAHAQRRHARIARNEMTVYSDAACPYGVNILGAQARAIVEGNVFTFFATNDIRSPAPGNIIRANACLSDTSGANISTGSNPCIVENNIGSVFRSGSAATSTFTRDSLGRKIARGGEAPTTGTWSRGDRVVNDLPAVGSPRGWTCTVAGTPGTWVSEGNL